MSDRRRTLIAPALLVAIALSQLALAALSGFSPWKGGGFGMFSSTDHGLSRGVIVLAVAADGGETSIPLPRRLRLLVRRLKHGPVRVLGSQLAREAARAARDKGMEVQQVRIRVTRVEYGEGWLEPQVSVVRQMDFDVSGD